MKTYINPQKKDWKRLTKRPIIKNKTLVKNVKKIIKEVKTEKDKSLIAFTRKFDAIDLQKIIVSQKEIEEADKEVNKKLKKAIQKAYNNIYKFHKNQQIKEPVIETIKGVKCWRKSVAIEKVGLYIPGGTAPLFSTVLMLGIPAKIAGCEEIIICTPPQKDKKINPVLLYTAKLVGINKIYKIGGAQAIAAMAYGTESIPQVNKIFGPGNQYVTKAKELVQQDGIAIDMPAGPSEVLIIADKTAKPQFVAADLLSQAEHGTDSQVILLSDNKKIIEKSLAELQKQLKKLPRKKIAQEALKNSLAVYFDKLETCFEFSNEYAPEHLIIASKNADIHIDKIKNAGSVFIGNYSCESAGDYASGTNHTLPTNGYSKSYSGVSLESFQKKITFQKLSKKGIKKLGNSIEIMAQAENLFAHKNAVSIRLKELKK